MMPITFFNKLPVGDNRGFTLIEAMIAMLVFTIGILATVSLQTSSLKANVHAEQTTEASSLAASVPEILNALDYLKDPQLTDGSHTLPNQDQYAITYTVQRDAILDDTMVIQVNVNWMEKGVQKSVRLVAIKPDII